MVKRKISLVLANASVIADGHIVLALYLLGAMNQERNMTTCFLICVAIAIADEDEYE